MNFYTSVHREWNNILFRGVMDGKRVQKRIPYKPTFYINSTTTEAKFRGLAGEFLAPVQFDSIEDATEFHKRYEAVENFKIYGINNYEVALIADLFPNDVTWDPLQLRIGYIDIEVAVEDGFPNIEQAAQPITAITYFDGNTYHVFACGEYFPNRHDRACPAPAQPIIYYNCVDDKDILTQFFTVWAQNYPDVVTGWSHTLFDIPYIINRATKLELDPKILSPWKMIKKRDVDINKKTRIFFDIVGVALLDYIDLYKSPQFNPKSGQESYSLNNISKVELGEEKVDYGEYKNLDELRVGNFQKFIDYNIRDVELVFRFEIKLRLIEIALTLAYQAKVNYGDVFHQTRMWDSIIYNHLKGKGIIVPPKPLAAKREQFIGAYVKPTQVGLHNWVASFDLTSLYPMLIMQYNISPETMITEMDDEYQWLKDGTSFQNIDVDKLIDQKADLRILKEYNVTMTPNGQFFRKDHQGFMPELMATMFEKRAMFKKQMLTAKKQLEITTDKVAKQKLENDIARFNNTQATLKICLNSLYGVLGSPYFRFFDVNIAEAVTLSAQLNIRFIGKRLNELINKMAGTEHYDYVIASDTDSVYLDLEMIIKQWPATDKKSTIKIMDKLCKDVLQPYIDKSFHKLAEYMNVYEHKMSMKREVLADKGIWNAKKNYFLNVWDSEGVEYAKPQIKITGLQAIRSSTPEACRKAVKEVFEIIMNGDVKQLRTYVTEFHGKFMQMSPYEIGAPRSANGLKEYSDRENIFRKSTPIQVKGTLIFNHHLQKMNLTKKYQRIKEGEKIKFIYLKEPNPLHASVIAFQDEIPTEFDLNKYLDYDTMYEKTFIDSFKSVLESVKWKLEEESTLEDFFN